MRVRPIGVLSPAYCNQDDCLLWATHHLAPMGGRSWQNASVVTVLHGLALAFLEFAQGIDSPQLQNGVAHR